jgi:hypothetical protein
VQLKKKMLSSAFLRETPRVLCETPRNRFLDLETENEPPAYRDCPSARLTAHSPKIKQFFTNWHTVGATLVVAPGQAQGTAPTEALGKEPQEPHYMKKE